MCRPRDVQILSNAIIISNLSFLKSSKIYCFLNTGNAGILAETEPF